MILNKIKKMQKRTLTFIGMFALGNIMFFGVQYKEILSFISNYNTETVYITQNKVHRAQPLKHSLVRAEKIDKKNYKKDYHTASALGDITQYVFTHKLPAGTTISKGDITLKNQDFIRTILKDGYRSVLLNVDTKLLSKDLVGGWRVDVTYTENSRSSHNETTLLLCALKVLDISHAAHYIILEATPDDALKLLSSYKTGTLNFLAVSRSENVDDSPKQCGKAKEFKTQISRGS